MADDSRISPLTIALPLAVAAVFLLVGILAWQMGKSASQKQSQPNGEQVFCTQDAMQCPNGTWVGRTGPNCEFTCPDQ